MLPFGSVRIGRILGIDVELNYTWFVIFGLVAVSLTYVFQAKPFNLSLPISIVDSIITTIVFFASVLFHEFSHSYVAKLNKLPIKKITLFIFGGIAHMSEEPQSAAVEFKMAIAGPISSFVLSATFGFLWLVLKFLGLGLAFTASLQWLFQINLALGVFNLAPGFPLDGGRVLRAALWYFMDDLYRATYIASKAGQGVAFILIFGGLIGTFYVDLGYLWLVLIGWFLNQAARSSYQQLRFQELLSDVKVSELMTEEVLTVDPLVSLDTLVNDYFLKYKFGRFPVSQGSELLGIITLHDIKEVPRERWHLMQAKDILKPLAEAAVIDPNDEAVKALIQMAKQDIGHLLVVKGGRLVGLITRSDIIRLIKVKTELGF